MKLKKNQMKLKNGKKRKDLKYETKKNAYDFQKCETARSFGDNIHTGKQMK